MGTHARHATPADADDMRKNMRGGTGAGASRQGEHSVAGRIATVMAFALLVTSLLATPATLSACSDPDATGGRQATNQAGTAPTPADTLGTGTQEAGEPGDGTPAPAQQTRPRETPEQRELRRQEALKATIRTSVAPSPYEEDSLLYGNEPAEDGAGLSGTEGEISMSSDAARGTIALAELSRAIAEVEEQGYSVGIAVRDLSGEGILAYGADNPLYPASAIKGPYVLSVWRDAGSPSGSVRRWAERIFGWSDNDSYHAMQDAYGGSPLRRLADECDLDLSWYGGDKWSWSQWYYPHTSASDMSRMWVACSGCVLDEDSNDAEELRGLILDREVSPIRDGLGDVPATYAKAGWISEGGDYGATPAAVDAGIVAWPDGRAYVMAIMTDTEEDMDAVATIAACVDRCHFAMTHPAGAQDATTPATTLTRLSYDATAQPSGRPVAVSETSPGEVPATSQGGPEALRDMLASGARDGMHAPQDRL